MRPEHEVVKELRRVKRLHKEELTRGRLHTAEALKQRGYGLCWVLGTYWGDVIPEEAED